MMATWVYGRKRLAQQYGSSDSRSQPGGGEEHNGGAKVLDCRRWDGFVVVMVVELSVDVRCEQLEA
jgi:hypothetical protein